MSLLTQKHLYDEKAAYAWVEAHVWPNGPTCPKCGERERVSKMKGKSTRIGAYKCYKCRKPFTVKVGTIFESSHVPIHKWLQAFYLICGSKKGISANQLHRTLDVTLKTAWFMGHRIREAMRSGSLAPSQMGGEGQHAEVDETYIGTKKSAKNYRTRAAYHDKMAVLTLVMRGGEARSFHIKETTRREIIPIVQSNISRETKISTDQAHRYRVLGKHFAEHGSVNHGKDEWRRGEFSTNTVEGYFSIFKRGMKGVYQHCDEKHLHRYLAEFDFRYNNRAKLGVDDENRTVRAIRGVVGKRLTYRPPNKEVSHAQKEEARD